MIEMTPLIQVALTGAIGLATVGATWYLLSANRGKIEADTASTLTDSAGKWVNRLDGRIDELTSKLASLKKENDRLGEELRVVKMESARYRAWAKLLVAQVSEHGGDPIPFEDVK